MSEWSKCGKFLTGYGLLLRSTDPEQLEDVIHYIENGHPSIDEEHFCYQALQELSQFDEAEIIQLWQSLHSD